MKRIIIALTAIMALAVPHIASQTDNRLFPYPEPPEEMTNLYERCSFLVDKFWERCNFKSAFSAKAKLNAAFGDWLGFMPYASADTVYSAIDRLHEKVRKSGEQSLEVVRMAEGWLYSDTAQFRSDDLYSRFVDAAVANKKIPVEERRRYESHKRILDSSRVGAVIPDLELTLADGTKRGFHADSSDFTLLFIYDGDCPDCSLARVRLSADMVLNQLNDAGVVRVMSLYAGEPDAAFSEAVSSFPSNWLNAASAEAALDFDLREKPSIYYLDKDHKILAKNLVVDNILNAFRSMIK